MAIVLAAAAPSGDASVVFRRALVADALFHNFGDCRTACAPAAVHHSATPLASLPPSYRYVGFGSLDAQQRPGLWANPYFFLNLSPVAALARFIAYLGDRCDIDSFLRPLAGATLLCDCSLGVHCHAYALQREVNERFSALSELEACPSVPPVPAGVRIAGAAPSVEALLSEVCLPDADDPDDDDATVSGTRRSLDDLRRVNETLRGSRLCPGSERPAWRTSWFILIKVVRSAKRPLFWEIFAGNAGLTREFLRQGWASAPPIDILNNEDHDCTDPGFVAVIIGLVLERRFILIHLGPPCSSFSMAVNRFPVHAMRSRAEPSGFEGLKPHQQEKVVLGNALAEVAARLIEAQTRSGGLWTLEQPATSIMWDFPAIRTLMTKLQAIFVLTDVCWFGAPWRKPTTIATNHQPLLQVAKKCVCQRPHLSLQGNCPDGRSWTAVASPYWPSYAAAWAASFADVRPTCDQLLPIPSHLAGFAVSPDSWTMDDILCNMGFHQPKNRENFTAAVRTCAGIQPAGRSMPLLVPEGIGAAAHLAVALRTTHPMARPVVLPKRCQAALEAQPADTRVLCSRRIDMIALLQDLADACVPENELLLSFLHHNVWMTARHRNIAFMRELSFVCGGCDPHLFIDYCFGLPMYGMARHSSTLMQRASRQPAPPSNNAELDSLNRLVLTRVKSTGDVALDVAAYDKTLLEFEKGSMIGPFDSLSDLPSGRKIFLPRFPIREKHGGAIDFSVRLIDDCKISGVNDESGNTAAHRPLDLDAWCALLRALGVWFGVALQGFTSDFKGAYRQVPSCPFQALDFIIVFWNPLTQAHSFGIATCQLFGSGNSPLNFCRYPDWCCTVLSAIFAILTDHCVDDLLCAERAETAMSAFLGWRNLARMCGWDVPDVKSPPPTTSFRALGAITDLTDFPGGPIRLRAAPDRIDAISNDLKAILASGFLRPAFAGKMFGKMSFMASQFYGRLGKALLRAFSRRQHDKKHISLNPQLRAACLYWVDCLPTLRPRELPLDLSAVPVAVSYSDGEGADGGIGVALWLPGQRAIAGHMLTPPSVRELWSRARTAGAEKLDIFEVEAIGPAVILGNWGHLMDGMLWLHFIDNESALACLVKGSSSVLSGEVITSYTHSMIAKHSILPWFDRVDTHSNPVDGLSRKDLAGDWTIVPITFPPVLERRLVTFLHP